MEAMGRNRFHGYVDKGRPKAEGLERVIRTCGICDITRIRKLRFLSG